MGLQVKGSFGKATISAVALSLFLTGCGKSEEKASTNVAKEETKQVLNLIETEEIPSMNSLKATDIISFRALQNTMEGLYRVNGDQEIVDGLAADMQVSDDQKTYTFTLRDAKWSNGEAITANDFVYAWQKMVDPETASEYAFIMYYLKNAEQINTGKLPVDQLGVKATDDQTLVVELEKPVPYFQRLLTFGTYYPLNQKFMEEQGDQYGLEADTILYSGPFVMSEWEHGESFQFEKNPNYWDKDTVKLEEINFDIVKEDATASNLFDTGEVDRAYISSDLVSKYQGSEEFHTELNSRSYFLRFNEKDEALKNPEVRQALSITYDRQAIVDTILTNGSEPLYGFVPSEFAQSPDGKDFREQNGNFQEMNIDEAKSLWANAKKSLGVDSLKIELLARDDIPTDKKIAEYLKEQWESNLEGLTVEIQNIPYKARLDRERKQEYQVSVSAWSPDYADPMTYLDMFVTGTTFNQMDYSSEAYDKYIDQAQSEYLTDPAKRWEVLLAAEKVLLEDAAISPIYQQGQAFVQKDYVKGIVKNQVGGDLDYKWAYIEN